MINHSFVSFDSVGQWDGWILNGLNFINGKLVAIDWSYVPLTQLLLVSKSSDVGKIEPIWALISLRQVLASE